MSGGKVARQSAATSIAAALSVASGLILDVVIAARYGAGRQTDAFFVGARLPIGLTVALMVGANQALVPAITTWLTKRGDAPTWKLVSQLLAAVAAITVALAAAFFVAARPLVALTAPGLDEAIVDTAVDVARIMAWTVPLVALAEVFRALLNARHSFVAPALMHVVLNGIVMGALLSQSSPPITRLAWFYLAGSAVQLAYLFVMSMARGFRPSFVPRRPDEAVTAALGLCVRPMLVAFMNPMARVGEQAFASFLPSGSITVLNYGYRLVSAIGGSVFFRSVIVTVVPRMTRAVANDEMARARRVAKTAMRLMLAVSIPLTAFMAMLAPPATALLFRRGSFTDDDARLLGLVLAVYAASLVGSGVQRALLAPFFARLDTKTPLVNTVIGIVVNLALLPALVLPFQGSANATIGVAVAYSIAQYANLWHAYTRLRHIFPEPFGGLVRFAVSLGFSGLVAAGAMGAVRYLGDWDGIGSTEVVDVAAELAAAGAAGAVALVVCLALTGGQDLARVLPSRMQRLVRGGRPAAPVP